MYILKATKEAIINHAAACYPNECCGFIVNREYIECKNIHDDPENEFKISPYDLVRAEKLGKIEAIVHSHPDGSSNPSTFDLIHMSKHGVPWVICSYPEIDIAVHKQLNYQAPLINREYIHGTLDCFSIVRDYYSRELDVRLITLSDKTCGGNPQTMLTYTLITLRHRVLCKSMTYSAMTLFFAVSCRLSTLITPLFIQVMMVA